MNISLRVLLLICISVASLPIVHAQSNRAPNADVLRQRVVSLERVELTDKTQNTQAVYNRALLRLYSELIGAIHAEIEDLRKIQTAVGDDSQTRKEIAASIESLEKESAALAKKSQALTIDLQARASVPQSHNSHSGADSISVNTSSSVPPVLKALHHTRNSATAVPTDESNRAVAAPLVQTETGRTRKTEDDYLPKVCDQVPTFYQNNRGRERPNGIIWCGNQDQAELSAQMLAERGAPILWFSQNEFLLNPDKLGRDGKITIPQKLFERDPSEAIVYYRISKLDVNSDEYEEDARALYEKEAKLNLAWLDGLTIRYYFYYPQDKGGGEHAHDLEYARYDVRVTEEVDKASGKKLYIVSLKQVLGGAHGITWYDNILNANQE